MSNKVIHAIYDDDDVLLKAVREVREADHHIEEVFTPFPVHGLEKAMGIANTRIAITAFIYGLIGLGFAVWMMNYMMIEDWPRNIGGKPSFSYAENMPAFVPIMFELTVFFSAHLMVITFYLRSKIGPFVKAQNPDPRTTDNMFLMEVAVEGDEKELSDFLTKTGAVETKIVETN
jgi:hypothetical protein